MDAIQIKPKLWNVRISPIFEGIHPPCAKHWASECISSACSRAQKGNQTSFCFTRLCGFVVTQITSQASTPLGMQGYPKPFWEIIHLLGFPAQFPSLTPENKCSLGLVLGEPCGIRQESWERKLYMSYLCVTWICPLSPLQSQGDAFTLAMAGWGLVVTLSLYL